MCDGKAEFSASLLDPSEIILKGYFFFFFFLEIRSFYNSPRIKLLSAAGAQLCFLGGKSKQN